MDQEEASDAGAALQNYRFGYAAWTWAYEGGWETVDGLPSPSADEDLVEADRESRLDDRECTEPVPGRSHLHLLASVSALTRSAGTSLMRILATLPGGSPAAEAVVCLDGQVVGRTDAGGELAFDVPGSPACGPRLVHDVAVRAGRGRLAREEWLRFESYRQQPTPPRLVARIVTDRSLYLPGDTLHAVVIAAAFDGAWTPLSGRPVELQLYGSTVGESPSACSTLDGYGTAAVDLVVPPDAKPGPARVMIMDEELDGVARVLVAEPVDDAAEIDDREPFAIAPGASEYAFDLELRAADGTPIERADLTAWLQECAGWAPVERRIDGPGPHHVALGRSLPPPADAVAGTIDGGVEPSATGATAPCEAGGCVETSGCGGAALLHIEVRTDDGRTAKVRRLLATDALEGSMELDSASVEPGSTVTAIGRLTWFHTEPVPFVPLRLRVATEGGPTREIQATTDERGEVRLPFAMGEERTQVELAWLSGGDVLGYDFVVPAGERGLWAERPAGAVTEGDPIPLRVVVRDWLAPAARTVRVDAVDPLEAISESFTLPLVRTDDRTTAEGTWTPPRWGRWRLNFSLPVRQTQARPWSCLQEGESPSAAPDWIAYSFSVVVQPAGKLRVEVERSSPLAVRVAQPGGEPAKARVVVAVADAGFLRMFDVLNEPLDASFDDPAIPSRATAQWKWGGWPLVGRNWGCDRSDMAMPPYDLYCGRECKCTLGRGSSGDRFGPYLCDPAEDRYETAPRRVDPAPIWMPELETTDGRVEVPFDLPADHRPRRIFVLAVDAAGRFGTAVLWLDPRPWDLGA